MLAKVRQLSEATHLEKFAEGRVVRLFLPQAIVRQREPGDVFVIRGSPVESCLFNKLAKRIDIGTSRSKSAQRVEERAAVCANAAQIEQYVGKKRDEAGARNDWRIAGAQRLGERLHMRRAVSRRSCRTPTTNLRFLPGTDHRSKTARR